VKKTFDKVLMGWCCFRYVLFSLAAGMQWPSWDRTLGLQSQQGMSMEKKDSTMRTINLERGGGGGLILLPAAPVAENLSKSSLGSCSDTTIMQQQLHHHHQIRNNKNNNSTKSRMLASRALEELARTHPPQSASIPCVFPRSDAPASIRGISNAWTAAAATSAAAVTQQQQPSLPPPPPVISASPGPTTQREDFTSVAWQPQPCPPPPPPAVIDVSSPASTTQRQDFLLLEFKYFFLT
jgi:hypothetical protein